MVKAISFIFKSISCAMLILFGTLVNGQRSTFAGGYSLVIITELQTGKGSLEFIEIENISGVEIDLDDFIVEYHNTTGAEWRSKPLTFTDPEDTLLAYGDRALLMGSGYNEGAGPDGSSPIATFSSGLADSGGSVRILPRDNEALVKYVTIESVENEEFEAAALEESTEDVGEDIEEEEETVDDPVLLGDYGDEVTWGESDPGECLIAPAHGEGESLKRFPSGDGYLVDTDSAGLDFYISNQPTPTLVDVYSEGAINDPFSIDEIVDYCGMPEDILDDEDAPGTIDDGASPDSPGVVTYLKIMITELFTDPVSPQTDSADEYIELYNPNEVEVNLVGYKLQSGLNSTYSYTFGDIILAPGEYFALSRSDSKLTLSNTSSKATLLDPRGEQVDESDPYDKSYQGQSWQLYSGIWQWSNSPTPSAVNVQKSTTAAVAKKVTTTPAAKKTTAKKTTAKKVVASKSGASSNAAESSSLTYTDDAGNTRIQPYVIWGAGILLLGYGLWEYRWDIAGLFKGRG